MLNDPTLTLTPGDTLLDARANLVNLFLGSHGMRMRDRTFLVALCVSAVALVAIRAVQPKTMASASTEPRLLTNAMQGDAEDGKSGPPAAPQEITDAVAAAASIGAEATASVDFDSESVLVFKWSGSGQDRIEAKREGNKISFHHSQGRTKDLRPHFVVFALPKGQEWAFVEHQRAPHNGQTGRVIWPAVVGLTGEAAVAKIKTERPDFDVGVVPEGSMVTMDYREDRVRVWVNAEGIVAQAPRIG